MALFKLLNTEAIGTRRDIIIAATVSGVANALILALINEAAETAASETLNVRYFVMFLVTISIYVVGLKFTFDVSTRIFETMISRIRQRLVEKIAGSEILILDQIGKAQILKRITQDTAVISESQGLLVAALQSCVMVLCTAIYVLTISLPAFLTIIGIILGGLMIYFQREKQMATYINQASQKEIAFVGLTNDLLDGLKEIKINQGRGRAVIADLLTISENLRNIRIKATNLYNMNALFSQVFFYGLLGATVFILPQFLEGYVPILPRLVATILFIIGPLSTIVTAVPAFERANIASESMFHLETLIDSFNAKVGSTVATGKPLQFQKSIAVNALTFAYEDRHGSGFGIGPLQLTIPQGKMIMIIGGNGSGKTTFLKVLSGLYTPTGGGITIDGMAVKRTNLQDYRELFSVIFTDFHLFHRIYRSDPVDDADVNALLTRMEMDRKVQCQDGQFSTIDLSTGQRKRLAMVVELLEDKPIMVMDEWAADQDPNFRRYFYEVLLLELRDKKKKTLLVATHDDRYFHIADIVVRMEMGNITSIEYKEDSHFPTKAEAEPDPPPAKPSEQG